MRTNVNPSKKKRPFNSIKLEFLQYLRLINKETESGAQLFITHAHTKKICTYDSEFKSTESLLYLIHHNVKADIVDI